MTCENCNMGKVPILGKLGGSTDCAGVNAGEVVGYSDCGVCKGRDMVSNCCWAALVEETDICSGCGEHCEPVWEDEE